MEQMNSVLEKKYIAIVKGIEIDWAIWLSFLN